MTLEQIKAEIKERLAQTNAKREEQESTVDVPDYFSGLFDGVANGFDQVLVLLDQLEPSFHPYPQEKPPRYGWYNVTLDDNGRLEVYTSFYSKGGFVWFYDNNIIAWAELPKPYKKEDEK